MTPDRSRHRVDLPLPEGPVITIPAGSNNIPVTSTEGFTVGGKTVYTIGDANKVANIKAAIWGAWDVAMKI